MQKINECIARLMLDNNITVEELSQEIDMDVEDIEAILRTESSPLSDKLLFDLIQRHEPVFMLLKK